MNNGTPFLSIVVPAYNVEEYLPQCVDSILRQTFTDFELLLVDDGSKDSTGRLCDEYAGKDRRIRVIHKENGGLVSARKAGLSEALGTYVAYVDGDDWIAECMMEKPFSPVQAITLAMDLQEHSASSTQIKTTSFSMYTRHPGE